MKNSETDVKISILSASEVGHMLKQLNVSFVEDVAIINKEQLSVADTLHTEISEKAKRLNQNLSNVVEDSNISNILKKKLK